MAEMDSGKVLKRHSIRTDFVMLLHYSIIGFFAAGWLLLVLILAASGERILRDGADFFMVFIFPLIFGTFLSIISVAFSNILRKNWWIAVFGTILLLGIPIFALVITWIGKQIARLFYQATASDLQRTKIILDMTVNPRRGIIYDAPLEAAAEQKAGEAPSQKAIEEKSKRQTAELKAPAAIVEQRKPALPAYFGLWQCAAAALVGGVFAGGMLLASNYKQLQERRYYVIGIIVSLVGQFALMILMIGLSYSDTSTLALIPIVLGISIGAYFWYSELQKEDIDLVIQTNRGEKRSWWLVIVFIVLSWIIFAIFSPLAEQIVWALDMPFM